MEPKINDYQYFLERNGEAFKSPEGAYLTDMLSDEGADYIAKKSAKAKPFFLYMAYNAPHSPLHGKTEDLQHLYPDHKPANPGNGIDFTDYEKRQNYVAMMYAVDRGVKQLVDTLKDPNGDGNADDSIMEETLIVFMSDNGGKILQAASNAPLQDDKGSAHEGGIRVPMFMHWPEKVPAGDVFDHPVLALDFYPTFAGLAGAKIPKNKKLDGKDIWSDFLAGKNSHPDEPIFWLRHHGSGNEVAIRVGNLKAYRKNLSSWKIYDVTTDFSESDDVSKEHVELLNSMVAEGLQWSQTHQEPKWHDTKAALDTWTKNTMPYYEKTFRVK